jgi:hypothetical protein
MRQLIAKDKQGLISPSDLRREAQRLITANEMPSLEELLLAVADVREKYGPRLKRLRESEAARRAR